MNEKDTALSTLRQRIEMLAFYVERDLVETITLCQAVAANRGDDELLDQLCILKREFLPS